MDCGRARGFERTLPGGHYGFGVLLRCRGAQLPGDGTSRHGSSGAAKSAPVDYAWHRSGRLDKAARG